MNKYFISAAIIIVIGLILGITAFKVVDSYNEKVLLVESKYIIEKAKDCLNQKKCTGDMITLKELYEKKFLERQVNEVTKEYYNEKSYVEIKDSKYKFIIIT